MRAHVFASRIRSLPLGAHRDTSFVVRNQLGPAKVVGGCAFHLFDLMRAHKCLHFKDRIFPCIVLSELPGFVHTKVSKFYS